MSKYPDLRSVGLLHGYVNKLSDDGDHPHRHLGEAMVGSPDCVEGRVVILTKDDSGNIAITNFRKHDEHMLQDYTVETIVNPKDDTWERLNANLDTSIHPGNHGYADDSNFMIQDHAIERNLRTQQEVRNNMPLNPNATEDNYLIQARFTNNDTKPAEVRDLVYDTLQDHLGGDVKSSRIFIASEMNDGSVHISHVATTQNQTRSEVSNFMFTNGSSMFNNMTAGFDRALDQIAGGYPTQVEYENSGDLSGSIALETRKG